PQCLLSASSMLQELGLDELKRRLKQWERDFQAEAGHRPSAKDVDRDPEIRRLYWRYSELRSLSWQAAPAPLSTSVPAASTASSLTSELGAKLLNNLQQRRLSRAVESCRDSEMSPVARAPASPAAAPPSPLPPPSSPRNSGEKTSPSPSAPVAAGVAKAAAIKPARLSKSACRFSYLSKSNCQLDSEPPLTPASDQQQLEFRSTYSSGPEPAAPFESFDLASVTVAKQQEISVAKEHLPVVKPATFDFLAKPAAAPSATPPDEDSSPAAGKENSGGASAGKRKSAKRPAVVSDEEENGAAPTTKAKPKAKAAKRPRSAVPPVASSAAPVSSFAAAPSGGGSGFASSASSSANYVKVNLRVKRFSRGGAGKGRAKFRNFKRAEWKRKSRLNGANANRCFACGEEGHWADKCPRPKVGRREATDGAPAPVGAPAEDDGIGEEEFSDSLVATPAAAPSVDLAALEAARPPDFPGDLRTVQRPHSAAGGGGGPPPHIEPLADEVPTSEVRALLRRFGHADFRPGQADAIGRVLAGRSALVVMATGAGKSLCYQLPALLYHSKRAGAVALVISPLQALMEDQLSRLPACLPAACLHSGQSAELRDRIRADAAAGRLACLLVSPEMLVDGAVALRLPAGVSFACIDEAHCLADWSHHFRPAYLRVLSVLRSVYSVRCFLGLTATAGPLTARSVARLLDADPLLNPGPPLPSNLRLSASSAGFNKTEALLQLLDSEPYKSCGSILIYCGSRAEAEAVAGLLRTSLGGAAAARAYHAGMSAAERRRAQRAFTSGRCRILAATVALGMGLDKPDVRCVLHFSPPASYRDYVQEVGRAGRDGDPAYCHTLLAHPPGADLLRLQRHVFANCVEPTGVKALIRRLFPVKPDCRLCAAGAAEAAEADKIECEGGAVSGQSWPPGGHLRALDIAETVAELDSTEETIETLLCYLQLRFPGRCRLLGRANSRYSLSSYSGPAGLAWAASRCLCVAAALADRAAAAAAAGAAAEADDGANPTIDLAALCDRFGWDPSAVGRDLAGIEWNDSGRRSGVVAKPERPAWMLLARCCQGHEVADRLANHVIARLRRVERCALSDMRRLHRLLARSASVAADHGNNDSVPSNQEPGESSGDSLHDAASRAIAAGVFAYFANSVEGDDRFEGGAGEDDAEDDDDAVDESTLACVRAGVRAFIGLYGGEHRLTARNIACVMHGIGTPNFPAVVWGRVRRFWRLHEAVPWPAVRRAALEELLATL
ncbi:hypothetical protein BOX15_Mlig020789g1, partial [Macrostomum lignano]